MADFYIDHDVAIRVAELLRDLGHTARTAHDLRRETASDSEHLLLAAANRWILVTHNRKDFRLLCRAWLDWQAAWGTGHSHAGILVLPQAPARDSAAKLHEFVTTVIEPITNQLLEWRPATAWQRWI